MASMPGCCNLRILATSSFLAGLAVLGWACAATAASRSERVKRDFFSMGHLKRPAGKPQPCGEPAARTAEILGYASRRSARRHRRGRGLRFGTAFCRGRLPGCFLLRVVEVPRSRLHLRVPRAVAAHGIAFDGLGGRGAAFAIRFGDDLVSHGVSPVFVRSASSLRRYAFRGRSPPRPAWRTARAVPSEAGRSGSAACLRCPSSPRDRRWSWSRRAGYPTAARSGGRGWRGGRRRSATAITGGRHHLRRLRGARALAAAAGMGPGTPAPPAVRALRQPSCRPRACGFVQRCFSSARAAGIRWSSAGPARRWRAGVSLRMQQHGATHGHRGWSEPGFGSLAALSDTLPRWHA